MSRYFAPNYIARAFTAALSSFISFSAAFLILLVTREHYGTHFAITIGAVGSVFGLISVASAGFTVHTLMASAKPFATLQETAASEPRTEEAAAELRSIIASEFRPALTMTVIVAVISFALSIWGPHLFGVSAEYFYPYWGPYLAVLLLGPLTAVIAGLTQSAAQDGFGLWVSILSTGLTVASAVIGMVADLDAHIALAIIGLTSVGVRLVTTAMRLARLRGFRIGIVSALRRALNPDSATRVTWRDFSPVPHFLTTIDGFVFLLTYTVAISVAAHHSPADGAMIALIVSLMRALIVPIKQLGIVGGRMSRQGLLSPAEVDAGSTLRADLRVVQFSSAVVTVVTGVVILVLMLTGIIHISPLLIILLVTAQVVLEPWAGILFSFLKVASGPKVGLSALLISYVGFGLLGLIIIAVTDHGNAVTIWSWLIAIRLLFLVLINRTTHLWVHRDE